MVPPFSCFPLLIPCFFILHLEIVFLLIVLRDFSPPVVEYRTHFSLTPCPSRQDDNCLLFPIRPCFFLNVPFRCRKRTFSSSPSFPGDFLCLAPFLSSRSRRKITNPLGRGCRHFICSLSVLPCAPAHAASFFLS